MKKIALIVLACSLATIDSFAQNKFPPSGYAGIGTENPEQLLHIKSGTSETNYGLKIEGFQGFSSGVRFQNSTPTTGKTYSLYSTFDGHFILGDENLQKVKMALWNTGQFAFASDVAVGWVDPSEPVGARQLAVNGTVRARSFFESTSGSMDAGQFHYALSDPEKGPRFAIGMYQAEAPSNVGSNFAIWRYDNNGNYLDMALSINRGNGSVGIGTTATGTNKLAVEGTIAARKVKVTVTNPFPDYVFAVAYKLPTLLEIESFIRENHRLPEMPSAQEVEKDGLDIGNNQVLLVKKLEELTLYLIEQNKRLEEKDKQIAQLTDQLNKLTDLSIRVEKLEQMKN